MRILDPNQTFTVCAGERPIIGDVLHCPLRSACTAHHHYIKAEAGLLKAGRVAEYRPDSGDEFCHFPTPEHE
ncbi:hypothetical protein BLX24_19330 [Arsenicibacter rosenii]|uniref:Uncharacterized protein n=1 Tax=Arsenicibacter rosenii TaxID=1750698 RepID=A0A1S2VGT7_9BACT|nr:hypothetical protein BLX24_19330 [Arsenicibacter rosenii]